MDVLTGLVAAIGLFVVVSTRPIRGFGAYLLILLLYPGYLRISVGSVDLSANRIVIFALLIKCLVTPGIVGRFRWHLLDTLVATLTVSSALIMLMTVPLEGWIENRGGFVLDAFIPYLVVRMLIVDRRSFCFAAKVLAVCVVFLAFVGIMETFMGTSPYRGLGQYATYAKNRGMVFQTRFGLNRAEGPFGEGIIFGLFFVSMLPIVWTLRYETGAWGRAAPFVTVCALVGVLSTLSSGPYAAAAVALAALALERNKKLVPPLIGVFLLGCVAVEIISNRHFYDALMSRIAMNSSNAWYRSEILEISVKKLPEYWLTGYGLADPGWGVLIDERDKTDIVNDYVLHAVRYGVFGLLVYVWLLACAVRMVRRTHNLAKDPWVRSVCWAIVSALIALLFAFWSVALFTQMVSVFYVLLGLHGCLGSVGLRARRLAAAGAPPRQRTSAMHTWRPVHDGSR